jgi:hypothetical protein
MRNLIKAAVLSLVVPTLALAQNTDHQYRGQGYFFFGLGTGTVYISRQVIEQVGFGGEGFLYKGFGLGAEAGYAHWGAYTNQAWIASGDVSYHFRRSAARGRADPFVLIGATGFFPTSEGRGAPAGDFGGGVNIWLRQRAALRLEVRDYVNPEDNDYPSTHYVSFRVGLTFR